MSTVFVHKTGFMHHVLRHLSTGYTDYCTGIVPARKILNTLAKLQHKYETEINKQKRARRKKAGHCNAVVFCYPLRNGTDFQFFLMVSPGEGPIRKSEKLVSALDRKHRLVFDEMYQAVPLPQKGGKTAWTWRFTSDKLEEYRATLTDIVRVKRSKAALQDFVAVLERTAGFRGVRKQVADLRHAAVVDWVRVNTEATLPELVSKGMYLRHQKYAKVPLELMVERMLKGKKPVAHSWRYSKDVGGTPLVSLAPRNEDGKTTEED